MSTATTKKDPKPEPETEENAFLLIQRGGTSQELYLHSHDCLESAKEDRVSCARSAYETSRIVTVPSKLAATPGFYEAVEAILEALTDMDQPTTIEEA